MTQDQALKIVFEIIKRADTRMLNKKDGEELKKLEPFIEDSVFGDLWGLVGLHQVLKIKYELLIFVDVGSLVISSIKKDDFSF